MTRLIPLLYTFRTSEVDWHSATLSGIKQHREYMFTLLLEVAGRHDVTTLAQLVNGVAARIAEDPATWSPEFQVRLARLARS